MSLRAIVALILEACLLILVMGTEIREFLIAAACLGGLLALSLISVLWAAFCLRVKCINKNTFCEREKNTEFTFNIKGLLVLPVIFKITIRTPFKERRKAIFPIYNHFVLDTFKFSRGFDFKMNCPHSGIWSVGAKRIRICDIFGFFSLPVFFAPKMNQEFQISVTPKYYPRKALNEVLGGVDNYSGLSFGNSELGETFDDNREYRYGDPLRRINWKQSAKFRKPITRMYEMPKKSRAKVLIDYYTLESGSDCDDAYRETALYIAEFFIEQKNEVVISYLRPEFLSSDYCYNEITELSNLSLELAGLSFKKSKSPLTDTPLNDFDFYDRDHIFIITSNPHPSLMALVENMNDQGVFASVIVAKTKALPDIEDSYYLTVLNSCEEIPEKVGGLLC